MTAASASAPALERRRERRIPVHLSIVIRGTDRTGSAFEERTVSEDVCRGGAAIVTRHPLVPGSQLEIQFAEPPAATAERAQHATHGRVVHIKAGRTVQELIVGVEFVS